MVDPRHMLNALRAFEAAARLRSVRKAALELSVTDGAVSRQIKNLEDALGVELFERGNRSIRLTPPAADYAATITEAFAAIARGTEHLLSASGDTTLVLAAPDAFLLRWLIPRLDRLERVLPNISVRLATWTRALNPNDPSIDIYIGIGPILEIPGMQVVAVAPETFGPVVSPRLIAGHEGDIDYLWSLPRLAPEFPPDMWPNWAAHAGIAPPHKEMVWYELVFYALQAAEAGLGVTIGPAPSVADAIRDGRLVAPLGMAHLEGCYYLAWQNERPAHRMNAVRRWFEQEFAESLPASLR